MWDVEFVLSVSPKSSYEPYPDSDSVILPTDSTCSSTSDVWWEDPDLARHYSCFRDVRDHLGGYGREAQEFKAAYPTWAERGLWVL